MNADLRLKMAPVDTSPASNMCGFELISSLKSNDLIPVHQFKSTNTGLTVFIAEVDGPVVTGHFVLVTEAHDDDGLPHTLEHLIFLGSENYPYKGVLDLLANRCLASGTDARTDVDNTYYTLTTAGSEGFLTLMPIYLDHILYPTLKESAFITEVHHITPDGDDAGIVYCEIQGGENSGEVLSYKEMVRKVYSGDCGYRYNTGGSLKNLRETTSNEKVRAYHKEFYRPENLYIVITGRVNHADVFKALKPVEEKIMAKGSRGPFKKPWQDPVEPLAESVDLDVKYPCDDEDNGLVYCGWQGPSVVKDYATFKACDVMLMYLSKSSVSPLRKAFTEIDDPMASNVGFSLSENSVSMLMLIFMNVPLAKMDQVKPSLMKVLNSIASNGIDMKRLHAVINRHILETLSHLETIPHDSVAYMIIGHVLYGETKDDLNVRLNEVETFKKFLDEPASYWVSLLQKYFIDNPMVFTKGIPSIEKKEEMAEEEQERVKKQIESLGEKGLEQKQKELIEAIQENERKIPPECLNSVPVPSIVSISYHNIKSYITESDQHPKLDLNKLPFYAYLDNVNTNFVYIFAVMDTFALPKHHRLYLPILLESLLESPIERNGELIPYQQVVSELEYDTVAATTRLGYMSSSRFHCGGYNYIATLLLQTTFSKYEKTVQWVKEILFSSKITEVERLNVIANKIINDVAQMKRKENAVCRDLMKGLIYSDESNHYAVNVLRQHKFLTKLLKELSTPEGQKKVLNELESVRKILTSSENLVIFMATNVDKLAAHVPNLYASWEKNFPEFKNITEKTRIYITPDYTLLKDPIDIPIRGCVTGMGCTESGCLRHCTPSIRDPDHPDLAPLLVCLKYLDQVEGPMWKQIRGQGLSYSFGLFHDPNEGLLYLTFANATSLLGSFRETKLIIETVLKDKMWDPLVFESGKSSLIHELISLEQSVRKLVELSVLIYFKNVPHDYYRNLVKRTSMVTIDDMDRIAQTYIKPLFDPEKSWTSVVCHPSKVDEVAEGLKKMGHDLKVYKSLQETYLNDDVITRNSC